MKRECDRKALRFAGAAALVLGICALPALGEVINGVTYIGGVTIQSVTSDNLYGLQRPAVSIVNGVGLNALTGQHGNDPYNPQQSLWHGDWAAGNPQVVVFNLGAICDLSQVHVWNFNEPGDVNGNFSVKDLTISTSADNITYSPPVAYVFDPASGLATDPGKDYGLVATGVQYVKFSITSNYRTAYSFGPGLSEVRFLAGSGVIAPKILSQPVGGTSLIATSFMFTVTASGTAPLAYQWFKGASAIADATNTSLSFASLAWRDAGTYHVVVSNPGGSVTSSVATLTLVLPNPLPPDSEPLGPPRRRSGLAFSEIMYHPRDRTDGRNLEFIEIFNSNPWPEDLGGWRLAGSVDFTFPSGASIAGLGFLVVAPSPADVAAIYGITGVLGGFTNNLPNEGGTVRLVKRSGGIVLEVTYSDQPPWPAAADGTGHSLVLARPSLGEENPKAWAASAFIRGSPGGPEPVAATPQDYVLINELLAHTDPPLTDYIELYNSGPVPADLSGCWLTDERNTNKFRIVDGTVLLPQGFIAFDEAPLGFGLSAVGETVYLVNSDQTRVIDAVRFGGQAQGVSWGRYPDGAPTFSALSARTPGTNNAPVLLPPVVINEIMFNPISGSSDDEFVELFNRGANALDLGGWRLTDGVDFTFPKPTVMAPGQYLVVANNAAHLRTNYPGLTAANCLGNYGGTLANGGERIALEKPDMVVTTNSLGGLVTNTFRVVVNEVSYFDKSRWSRFADGGGSSLELIDSHADTRSPANWADSNESVKAPWTTVEFTGTVDNAMPNVNADQVQLFLLGEGEALVDDVEVLTNGVNRVSNGSFEAGVTGWFFQGTQVRSSGEPNEGYNSARSLHLRASDRGEPIGNRVRGTLTTIIPANSKVTLRAKVRWLAGWPEFLMRLRGGGLEAAARLEVPSQLGTPGAPNSRARPNAGPIISDATHRPLLPSANQPIQVLARVTDPDGVASVTLRYRLDPSATLNAVPMRDDGAGGDVLAGDGVFTGLIPGQPGATMIAFRIEATDGAGVSATSMFPADAPARECLIRVGDQLIAGPFANYRIWMTQATLNHWATRGNLSNDPLDVTFVYGNTRVVYNAGSLYGGSPSWAPQLESPIGLNHGFYCAYDILLPGDDKILGEDKLFLDLPIRDTTNQREQLMHWIADQYNLPNLYRRDVHMFVNGVLRDSIYHDTQQPGGDILDEWFRGDANGSLLKTAPWSEGTDAGSFDGMVFNSLERFTSGGTLKTARYRWNWRLRVTDSQLDYTSFLALVEAVNAPANSYQSAVAGLVNVEDWMRMFAMNDLCSYWDAFGNPQAKNTYLYQTLHEGWRLIPWDFDIGLGVGADPVNDPLFPNNVDPTVRRMYAWPAFVRAYWRELEYGMNAFFQSSAVTPILTAKDNAYRANGLSFTSPFSPSGQYNLSITAWIDQRRAFLRTQLATVAASFSLLSPTNIITNSNTLLLSGRAPVSIKTITVNGAEYPIAWTTISNWTIRVPLVAGGNPLLLAGLDRSGKVVTNSTYAVTATYTGSDALAEQNVVFNEIMYHPLIPGASFIELLNRSTHYAFDLSGWRLNGVGYTFAPGAVLGPGAFLVLAQNRQAFTQAYGSGVAVFDAFDGQLDNGGETLTLIRPGATPSQDVVVDRVRYEPDAPWPASANGLGQSLQLIDAAQDNARVSNWTDGAGWRFFSYTDKIGASRLSLFFDSLGGDVYLDDVSLVAGSVPGAGPNLVANGDFESALNPAWLFSDLAANSHRTNGVAHSGTSSLHFIQRTGIATLNTFYQDVTPPVVTNATYTLSGWVLAGGGGTNFTMRAGIAFQAKPALQPNGPTPGAANFGTGPLSAYPAMWLNEVQPVNLTGPTDSASHRDPWVEIYNAGADAVSLDGYYLANNYSNLAQWSFPAGKTIAPGQFLVVWLDGDTGQNTATELHANFRATGTNGSIAFARSLGGGLQIADYLNYTDVPANESYGSVPDGQPFYRGVMFYTTPGATNNGSSAPLVVFINEWMAANTSASGFADPADGKYDDWFELYNPGAQPADLGGSFLTDNLTEKFQEQIPSNGHYVIPAGGYLLVWADGTPGQNSTNGADLHVNFSLRASGEDIGLFAADGTLIDAVTFTNQTANISFGRSPDGSDNIGILPLASPRAGNSALPPAPDVTDVTVSGANVTLTFTTQPGASYRVQFKDDLTPATWSDLPGDVTAVGNISTKNDTTNGRQRFYRILALP